MAQWTVEAAKKLIKQAHNDKEASDDIYREAMELTFPDRENFTKKSEGQRNAAHNWDSQPGVSVIRAANRLSSDFTPQFQNWLEIGLGPAAMLMPDDAFKAATGKSKETMKMELEGTTSIVQAIFNGPGFPTASNEMYIDWHYGIGGMKIMPNDDIVNEPVLFSAMPLSHFYVNEGPNGKIDRWFFWHEMKADLIKREWQDAKLPTALAEKAALANPPTIKLCSVVYRDYDEAGPRPKPFRYEVFWFLGQENHRVVERQNRTPAFVTPRYSKLPGENRGRGPVLFALPDIRTANKIVELTLRAAAVAVGGVYTATEDGVSGPVRIKPLSIIQVRRNGGPNGPSLQRLDTPQRIDFGEILLEKLHENIKKTIGDNSLPSEAGPVRSPTEFISRVRELIADQSGGLGRLYAEAIIPQVQRVVDILESKQLLASDGLKIDQFLIEVRMTSPLAKGEAMQEVENLVRFVELLEMIGGKELVFYHADMDRLGALLADLMSVPERVRTTTEEKAGIKKAVTQAATAEAGGDPAQAEAALANAEGQIQ